MALRIQASEKSFLKKTEWRLKGKRSKNKKVIVLNKNRGSVGRLWVESAMTVQSEKVNGA